MLIFILLVIAAISGINGCAKTRKVSKASDTRKESPAIKPGSSNRGYEAKWLTDIGFSNEGQNFNVYIRGNRLLPYTTLKQSSPAALFLYFTDTAVSTEKTDLIVNNDIVETIRTSDAAEKGRETAKVEILLNKRFPNVLPYTITRDGPGIRITFKRPAGVSAQEDGSTEGNWSDTRSGSFDGGGTKNSETAYKTGNGSVSPAASVSASRLDSVYAARFDDGLKVFVGADGMITKYKAYTSANPPRIVFDIFGLRSPYEHEKIIPVNSNWVKMVRYQSYPDRLSLVLETFPQYLNAYSASPVDNGLMIHVGQGSFPKQAPGVNLALPDTVNFNTDSSRPIGLGDSGTDRRVSSYRTSSPQISEQAEGDTDYTKPAYVNQIELLKEDAGKSAVVLETSRPVRYEVRRTDNKKLEFKLFNTQIPDDLQHSITAKADDGVIRQITPSKPGPANSSINLDMREDIPYTVEQNGQRLILKFAALTTPADGNIADGSAPKPTPEPKSYSSETIAQASSPPAQPEFAPESKDTPSVASTGSQFQVQPIPATPPVNVAAAKPSAYPLPGGAGVGQPVSAKPLVKDFDLKLDLKKDSDSKTDLREDAPRKYTGEKIALDFYETDVKNVFRILREVSNMNFAVDKDVSGKVTLTLAEPVPWDQVLDLVLKMNKLGKTVDGNVIRVATAKTLDEEDKVRRDQKKAALEATVVQKQLEPFITEYISVNYSDAEKEVLPLVKDILTKDRGDSKEKATASVDKRTNMIIITDTADVVRKAKEMIGKLDRVTPQVMIEARIVEASTTFSKEIGTQWGSNVGIQNTDDAAGIGPERGYNILGGTYGYNMAVNLPISSTSGGALGFNFMRLAGTPFSLEAKLLAMESKGEGKIVSAPKVLTLDNKKATIKQGFKYPYYTRDVSGLSNLIFEEVVLLLDVTPHVTPDNRISILMKIDKKDLGETINTVQSFNLKQAETELLINDGETVVIGGIVKQTENTGNSGIPGLSKIPLLGWLFKSKTQNDRKEELLIFITPRIVQLEQRSVQN
jgi:type IV pilus assembly protein PilQ